MEFTAHTTWKFVYKRGPDIAYRTHITPHAQTIASDFLIWLYIDEKSNKLMIKCGIWIWKIICCFHSQFDIRNPPWEFSSNPPILGKFWLPNMGDLQIWRFHSLYMLYIICKEIHFRILMFSYTLNEKTRWFWYYFMIIGIICYSHHDFNGYIAPRHHYICLHNWETIGLNITQTLSRIMSKWWCIYTV